MNKITITHYFTNIRKLVFLLSLIPLSSSAQSLECDMLKEKIIAEYRQSSEVQTEQQQREEDYRVAQMGGQEGMNYLFSQGGRQLGKAIGKLAGGQSQLEQDIQKYKQNCE